MYESENRMFNFGDVYQLAVDEGKKNLQKQWNIDRLPFLGLIFVECGAWLGASAIDMVKRLKQAEIENFIRFYVYDTWRGNKGLYIHEVFPEINISHLDNFFHLFYHETYEYKDYMIPVMSDTLEASKSHKDNSVFFAYLDDCHEYSHLCNEIPLWWKKIMPGGILAGHDYLHEPEARAVNEFAEKNNLKLELIGVASWLLRKI